MSDKTASPSAAATDAFRSQFFFTASSLIVVCFCLQALPLGLLGRTFAVASAAAYRTGFFTATVAHGYRLVYTLKPKIAAAASNGSAGLQAAAPGLARELPFSNSFLYTLYCLLFLLSRPTALAMVPVAFTSLLQALTYLMKNPPAQSALWEKYGVRGYGLLQESLPVSLGMCATSQVMIGITLLLGLLSSNREVVRLTPSRRWRACCCRVCVCARALWLTRSGNAAGQDARVLEHHSARLFPLRRRNCVPHEAPGQQQHVPQAGVAGDRRQGGAAHLARSGAQPRQGGCVELVLRLRL